MKRTIGCFAISGCVGLCFTWAAVLAQVGGVSPQPVPAAAQAKKATEKGRAVAVEGKIEAGAAVVTALPTMAMSGPPSPRRNRRSSTPFASRAPFSLSRRTELL